MPVTEYNIEVRRSARYYTLGPTAGFRQVWFVLHGYGQLASYFIRHFTALDNDQRLIVAPEGLSRFYLSGFSGRTGASWMTREDRVKEIDDYVNYLDSISGDLGIGPRDEIFVLGFSQGAETAARWVRRSKSKPRRLILWAGLLPPELASPADLNALGSGLTLVVGRQDEFASEERLAQLEERLRSHRIAFELCKFNGGHELNSDTLLELASES